MLTCAASSWRIPPYQPRASLAEFEIGHSNLLATMIAPPHEFDLPCRFMIGGLANEQMLGWPVALNAAALLRRIHLRKERLHTCEHESVEGTFRHCIASAKRVAVGRRRGGERCADRATRAAAIVDYDRLAQAFM